MLGKGLESLMPQGGNGGIKKAPPPADLPVGEPEVVLAVQNFEPPQIQNLEQEKPKNPEPQTRAAKAHEESDKKSEDYIFYLDVDKIFPNPDQPRKHFSDDSIKELATSIREFGLLQPIVVTKKTEDAEYGTHVTYELIAGERRLRAVKLLGLPTVPAIIRNVDLERERLELAVIENLQREDLNVMEVARAYSRLQDEFRMTQREVAAKLGKSRETVANTLRLLDLPQDIQKALEEGKLSESHGRLLLAIGDPAAQIRLFAELMQKPMTTRELKNKVEILSDKNKAKESISPELKILTERLSSELGAPVAIERGKITIRFFSPEELQGILNRLSKEDF